MKINIKIIIITVCFIVGAIHFIIMYKNNQNNLLESYIAVDAKIKFVGRTGKANYVKSLLGVEYIYNDTEYSNNVLRTYSKKYKTGDVIKIYVNKNNEQDIK
jgi:hypothetical protein